MSPKAETELTFRTLDDAWWRWVRHGCPMRGLNGQLKWASSRTFVFEGTTWLLTFAKIDGRRTKVRVYTGADGREIREPVYRSVSSYHAPRATSGKREPKA